MDNMLIEQHRFHINHFLARKRKIIIDREKLYHKINKVSKELKKSKDFELDGFINYLGGTMMESTVDNANLPFRFVAFRFWVWIK
jgi:hypothetical protein